jgi:hypothetical protein
MTPVTVDDVDCYGEVQPNSNFYLVCEDEEYDGIWADGNPENTRDFTFKDWGEVVSILKKHYRADLVEIQEC